MKIATAKEMREIDRLAIEAYGIPEVVLMENAGTEVARSVIKQIGSLRGKKICVFSGKGNNGGDGFVAARHLHNQGAKVKVYVLGDAEAIQGAAKINLDILLAMEVDIMQLISERDWDKVKIALAFSDCLIDGLLGSGFRNGLSLEMEKLIHMINDAQKPTIAIDLPSGVEADTGRVTSAAVRADLTISFGLPKLGLLFYPGASFAGEIVVADIGLPNVLLCGEHIKQNMINTNTVKRMLVKRAPDAHKGSCGKVLVIAGSLGMTGAAALASSAALRAGAGVVILGIAQSLQEIVSMKLNEVMTRPLPEFEKGVIGESALPELLDMAMQCDVVVVGPGLGTNPSTARLIHEFVRQADRQLIIDADAVNAYQGMWESLRNAKLMPVLTPHLGELAKLFQLSVEEVKDDLIGVARMAAEKCNSIIVLKNARTVVAYPDGTLYVNIKGNSGMATAGSGDVLAGVIGSLFAQGMPSHSAAVSGVYLHALAGDLAANAGMVGLIAGDIAYALPVARAGIEA